MKQGICILVLVAFICSGSGQANSGDSTGHTGSDLIWGFNPKAPSTRAVIGQPSIAGVGGGFGGFLNSPGFALDGFGAGFQSPVGVLALVDTNFVALFPNQFGTNFVVLPFAATNLAPFAGRVPLGPLAPPVAPTPGNAAPGPAPAIPPQDPFIAFPQPSITPIVPPSGQLPNVPPAFPATGRPLAPPTPVAPAAAPR